MSTPESVARLQALLRVPTVSRDDPATTDWTQFDAFLTTLSELYPLAHTRLEREVVAGYSLLFRWSGRASAEPSVLMAHYDVVSATDAGWTHPPFDAKLSGRGKEQVLWGRGTLDNKGSLAAILEAVESQLAAGVQPAQDIYLVFTHDEETHGTGAKEIVNLLEGRGVRPALVLDEGGAIVRDVFPAVTAPVAVVGVTEKGSSTLRLVVDQQGGHASTPPEVTATVRLARAVDRLNEHPFPAAFNPTTIEMFRTLGQEATGFTGWLFRNIRFTRFLLLPRIARGGPELAALARTTQAVTMLHAGQAVNALAENATATVNVRVAVGTTIDQVVAHVRKAVADPEVRVEVIRGEEAAPVSLLSGLGWELLRATIEKSYPGTLVTPYVQNGATDSRQFTRISRGVYRFSAFEITKEQRDTLHARNERMQVGSYLRGIEFYRALVAAL